MINSFIIKNLPNLSIKYRNYINYGWEPEMKYLKILAQGKNAIDIGAHLGNYSYKLNQICDVTHVFEANIFLFDILKRSELVNCKFYNVACSNDEGFSILKIPQVEGIFRMGNATLESVDTIDNVTSHYNQPVILNKIDNYEFNDIGFIKIDVEGHELNVIEGSINTISKNKPNLIVEISSHHCEDRINNILAILPKFYEVFCILNETDIPKKITDYSTISVSGNYLFINKNNNTLF